MVNPSTDDDREPPTTSGAIALVNLHAQIDTQTTAACTASRQVDSHTAPQDRLALVDLLTLRGHLLGRIADYERAEELAEGLVHDAPRDATALLARARTRATFHRFDEALADLDSAELNGPHNPTLDMERAVIHQALADHTKAQALYAAAWRRPDFAALAALAVLHAERGDDTQAERLFTAARRGYRGTSPFPIASLDFRHALMWLRKGDLPTARAWLDASRRRVPAYAPVLARLADIDMARGSYDVAINRLTPLASSSDDPEIPAALARALNAAGRLREAEEQRATAAARYDQLTLRHPHAYADHAADFRREAFSHPARTW